MTGDAWPGARFLAAFEDAPAARRADVARAVGRIRRRGVRSDSALVRRFSMLPVRDREVALAILQKRGFRPAVPLFLRLLREGVGGDAWIALGLSSMGSARDFDALVRLATGHPNEGSRVYALMALQLWDLATVSTRRRAGLIDALIRVHRSPRDSLLTRGTALEVLGCAIGDDVDRRSAAARRGIDVLVEASRHPAPEIRADAAYALGQTHSARALAALRALRTDRTRVGNLGTVRSIAGYSLRQVAHARGRPRDRWTV